MHFRGNDRQNANPRRALIVSFFSLMRDLNRAECFDVGISTTHSHALLIHLQGEKAWRTIGFQNDVHA